MRRVTPSKNPSLPALGMALRAIRNEKRLTQEALGGRVGIHSTWVSHIEAGRVNPTLSNLALLSEGLEVKLSELIARAEEMDQELHAGQRSTD